MIKKDGMVVMSEAEYNEMKKTNKPNSVKEYAKQIGGLTQWDGIRMYFDKEQFEDICVSDSATIFNFFCTCEEVAYLIGNGRYEDAEKLIKAQKFEDVNWEAEYKELVRFLPKIVARRNQTTDIQLNRKDFLKLYGYAMQQMDIVELEDQDDKSEVLVYGNDFTVHYLGYFCSLGDGAAIYNHIIGGIEGLNEEEDDDYGEEES